MKKISILYIKFKNDITRREIPLFRGAVVAILQNNNVLFHNHTDGGFRYAYPLIQYKRINGRAAIVCVEEGTESIGDFFSGIRHLDTFRLGNRSIALESDTVKADKILIQLWDDVFSYTIRKWLPFNSENYNKFQQIAELKERIAFMEMILTGNILSFAKGVGIRFERELSCSIADMEEKEPMRYKGVTFSSFDMLFRTNVSLPNYIGLGKGVSHGFGTVVRMNNNEVKI
ncbi:MAG: hypothetical protein LBR34_05770 [Prevotella sp.]|jgi:hypothetical protein|nr:hypothetical protein [Prevotella sp.]